MEATDIKTAEPKPLKFDKSYLKRTIWIGLAFFGILLVWQLYNGYCSPMLSFLFAKADYPEIFLNAESQFQAAVEWAQTAPRDANGLLITSGASADIVKWVVDGKLLSFDMKSILRVGYLGQEEYLDVQWKVGIIMALDNIAALFIMPIFGNLSDKTHTKIGKRMPYIIVGSIVTAIAMPFIPFFFNAGMASTGAALVGNLAGLIAMMVVIIVFMMSYRSPAVALMPDLTPKPLRSKANGIINIVGYVGGLVGSLGGIFFAVTKYIDGSGKSLLMLEIPFLICSLVLVASVIALFFKVKENKLSEELALDIERGEAMGESAEQVTTNEKLSKNNIRNLALILVAEVFWFMSLNAVETFQTNYYMFWMNTSSAGGMIMTIVSGVGSVVGFLIAGMIADKIGRKWTIFAGICTVALCYVVYALIPNQIPADGHLTFEAGLPWAFFILCPIIGFGSSLIHICSFPLVTDYCTKDKLGRYTSLYYSASMGAQSITPIVIGLIFQATSWIAMPIYSAALMAIAGAVFFFVKAPHNKDTGTNAKGLDALGADD